MGRRTDHSQDELKEMILRAAEAIVAESSHAEMRARAIARRIGYSVGTIYNFFESLDDLKVHINARTLDALYDACTRGVKRGSPSQALRVYARAYIRFTEEHERLWLLLLDRSSPRAHELPPWYESKVTRLLQLIIDALQPCFSVRQEDQRQRAARVLWASLEGIAALARLRANDADAIELADDLIAHYLAGLR